MFVELFFVITGYFTTSHYDNLITNEPEKYALGYTLKKFKRVWPYICIVTLLMALSGKLFCLYDYDGLDVIENCLVNILYINGTGLRDVYTWQVWFVFVLVLVFPMFCMFLSNEKVKRIFVYIVAPFAPIVYYSTYGISAASDITGLYRAIFGLMVGTDVYYLSSMVDKFVLTNITRIIGTIIEIVTLCLLNVECTSI